MDEYHSLLKRQLRRFNGEAESLSPMQAELYKAINAAYRQFDEDRHMLEHSLELTSQELLERNAALSRINTELELRVAERTAALRASVNFIHSLYQVAQSVITLEDLPDVLQSVANTVAQTLVADRTSLIIFDHEAQQVTHLVSAGLGVENVIRTVSYAELMEGLSGWALRELRPAISPKGQPDDRESPAVQQRRLATNCGSIVVLPLLYLGEGLGTLTAINTPEQPDFTMQEVAWMETIANQAATAIGRARIYNQLKTANLLLEQQRGRLQAERDLLQALMDNIPDTIYFKDTASRFTRINSAQAKMLGIPAPEAAIGKTDFDFFQDAQLVQSFFDEEQRLIETGEPLINRIEFNPTKDGQPRWLSATKAPIKDPSGRVVGIVGVSRDITQRMQVEEALREAELKYRTLVEHMPAIIYVDLADESRNTIYISPQIQEMLGYSPEDWIAKPDFCNNIIHPEDSERMWGEAQKAEANGRFSCDYRYIAQDGRVVWVHDEAILLKNEAGEPSLWQGVMLDITAQKEAEEALRQSEEQFRLMAWATKDAVWDWNLKTNRIWWGGGLQKIFSYASDITETDKEWWLDHIHPQDKPKVDRSIQQALETGMEFWSKEYRFQRVDGTYADIMDRGYILHDEAGEPHRIIGAMMDITERKQAEQALLDSEARYRQIVESVGDIIFRVNARGRLTYVNPTALRIMGYKSEAEVLGRRYLEFVHPAWRERVRFAYERQIAETTLNTYLEFLALTRDRREIWLGQTVQIAVRKNRVIGFQVVARDITSQKESEAALQEANHKMGSFLNELQQRNHEIVLLNEMSRLLQICKSAEEAYGIIAQKAHQLFPYTAGALYMLNPERTLAQATATWGNPTGLKPVFAPEECQTLNSGVEAQAGSRRCAHFSEPRPAISYCLPIRAQGEIIGIFHLQTTAEENIDEPKHRLADTVVDQVGMALSNLGLRDALREQSIRDPLTGLYNRRYMEEVLKQQLSRVTRNLHPLGVIMLDIDHFKRINDTYGHAAGDALLRELGQFLKSHVRAEDIACRYGGEEFIMIMPDASLEATQQRAEYLQQAVKNLRVQRGPGDDSLLEGITLSLGVAVYPQHGRTKESVLRAADAALYCAKQAGRDRVILAEHG